MECQMVGGWIKRFPAALMGARRGARYTDHDKQTQARPRLHARRRAAERVPRAQENIVTIGCNRGRCRVGNDGGVFARRRLIRNVRAVIRRVVSGRIAVLVPQSCRPV